MLLPAILRLSHPISAFVLFAAILPATAQNMQVRFPEAPSHGFLVMKDGDGKIIASGESLQKMHGRILVSRTFFRFKDGSVDDETTVFSQDRQLHLLSDHHIQQGPSFPHPLDVMIDVRQGTVEQRIDKDGKPRSETTHMQIPGEIGNGMILSTLKNLPRQASGIKIPMLLAGPKPKLIKIAISQEDEDTYYVAGFPHKARCFVLKIELGPVSGVVAPILGKKPIDGHVWLTADEPPVMLKAQSQFYEGGPVWTIELSSPTWPRKQSNGE